MKRPASKKYADDFIKIEKNFNYVLQSNLVKFSELSPFFVQ